MEMKGLLDQLAPTSESPHLFGYKSRRLSVENHQLPRRSFSNMRTFTIVSLALLAGLLSPFNPRECRQSNLKPSFWLIRQRSNFLKLLKYWGQHSTIAAKHTCFWTQLAWVWFQAWLKFFRGKICQFFWDCSMTLFWWKQMVAWKCSSNSSSNGLWQATTGSQKRVRFIWPLRLLCIFSNLCYSIP